MSERYFGETLDAWAKREVKQIRYDYFRDRRQEEITTASKQEMSWDYCPSCAGELDTGFECLKCGRDWRPWATVYFGVRESKDEQ